MIYERDLDESIARYQGEVNPSINTCIKLAACYALKNELFGKPEQPEPLPAYSFAAAPAETFEKIIQYTSDTEFSRMIDGRDAADIWPIIDELMTTVQTLMPRLYDGVLRELRK